MVIDSTEVMMKNTDGSKLLIQVFMDDFHKKVNLEKDEIFSRFEEFYIQRFDQIKKISKVEPFARPIIQLLKDKGVKFAIATAPVFPEIATRKRIAWAGLDDFNFELITHAENFSYCKPNPQYITVFFLKKCYLDLNHLEFLKNCPVQSTPGLNGYKSILTNV